MGIENNMIKCPKDEDMKPLWEDITQPTTLVCSHSTGTLNLRGLLARQCVVDGALGRVATGKPGKARQP